MIYKSNLMAPDLAPHFRLKHEVRPWSLGHSIPSDPDFSPDCCFMSEDETAILAACARQVKGYWMDIGARTGWTTAAILSGGVAGIDAVDQDRGLRNRFWENIESVGKEAVNRTVLYSLSAKAAMAGVLKDPTGHTPPPYAGFCIDGDHDEPQPLLDAQGCLKIAAPNCCMVFHDFRGKPIRDACRFLMGSGWKCRVYWTPAMMAVCWRGDFTPPTHDRDPNVDWRQVRRSAEIDQDFNLTLCS